MDDKKPGYFVIKNWSKYQHYKDRCPPWIKLHATIFEDYDFDRLQDASKLLLVLIWVLASKLGEKIPRIPNDPDWIKRKIHINGTLNLKPLFNAGFLIMEQGDSEPLAGCLQDAITETEGETETETETEGDPTIPEEEFEKDWAMYPRKAGDKKKAFSCWMKTVWKKGEDARYNFIQKIIDYTASFDDTSFMKHGETFFRNWENIEIEKKQEKKQPKSWQEKEDEAFLNGR